MSQKTYQQQSVFRIVLKTDSKTQKNRVVIGKKISNFLLIANITQYFPNHEKFAERTAEPTLQLPRLYPQLLKSSTFGYFVMGILLEIKLKKLAYKKSPFKMTRMSQYIAMNRFRIVKGQESEFEEFGKPKYLP